MPSRRGLSRRSVGINPGVSTNTNSAGLVLLGLKYADSQSRRSSGILASPTCPPRCTAAGSGFLPVSHWNTVVLPLPAKPTRPTFIRRRGLGVRGQIRRLFDSVRYGAANEQTLYFR